MRGTVLNLINTVTVLNSGFAAGDERHGSGARIGLAVAGEFRYGQNGSASSVQLSMRTARNPSLRCPRNCTDIRSKSSSI